MHPCRASYPLILKDDTHIRDRFVEMKFKAVAGSEDRAAGIIWRDAGEKHELRNLSGQLYQNILVELKNGK